MKISDLFISLEKTPALTKNGVLQQAYQAAISQVDYPITGKTLIDKKTVAAVVTKNLSIAIFLKQLCTSKKINLELGRSALDKVASKIEVVIPKLTPYLNEKDDDFI